MAATQYTLVTAPYEILKGHKLELLLEVKGDYKMIPISFQSISGGRNPALGSWQHMEQQMS